MLVASLHVQLQEWEEAFALIKENKDTLGDEETTRSVYLPYAEWLAQTPAADIRARLLALSATL